MTRDECLSVLRVLAWHSMCVFYYRATGGDRLASRRPPASRVTVFPSSSRRLFKKSRPVFCESLSLITSSHSPRRTPSSAAATL